MSKIFTIKEADQQDVAIAEGGNNDHYFVKPLEEYIRDFSLLEDYFEINTNILMRELNISKALATELIHEIYEDSMESGEAHMPDLYYWEKNVDTQDRELAVLPLDKYIETAFEQKLRIAPSMTCFWTDDSPGVNRKIVPYESNWLLNNVKSRAIIKAEGLAALAKGNYERYEQLNPFQLAKKRGNNSLSGLESLKYLPIYTMTGHNSLTSPTRVITSTGNLTLERSVGGNRYYRNINEIMLEWEQSINKIDLVEIESVIKQFNLVYPTAEDLYQIAYMGGEWQFNVRKNKNKILKYASSFTPLERAAITYNLDIFNLYRLNNDVIGEFIYTASLQVKDISNDTSIIKDGRLRNAVHHILIDKLQGQGVDYDEFKGTELAWYLASTYINLSKVITRYSPILEAFFKNSKMFATHISDSKRIVKKVIKLSDTDSTCDSKYYFAREDNTTKYKYTNSGIARASVITWLTSGLIDGQLKQFAKNMGVETSKLNVLSVKPEVTWSTFIPSKAAKHYTTAAILEEFIALSEPEYHSSGVGLIAGQMHPKFKKFFEELKVVYHRAVNDGKELSAKDLDMFNQMFHNVLFRETLIDPQNLLKSARIKEPHLYSQDMYHSNYAGLDAYKEIFGFKYGIGLPAPTPIRSIPINTSDVNKMNKYLKTLDESKDEKIRTIASNFRSWLRKSGRTHITTIKVPVDIAGVEGWRIPEELIPILDTKRLIKGVYNQFKYFGKSLGAYGSGKNYEATTTQRTLGITDIDLPRELNAINSDHTIVIPYSSQKNYM